MKTNMLQNFTKNSEFYGFLAQVYVSCQRIGLYKKRWTALILKLYITFGCKIEFKIYSEKFLNFGTRIRVSLSVTGLKYLRHVEVIAVQKSLRVTGFSRRERILKLQKSVMKESEVFLGKTCSEFFNEN